MISAPASHTDRGVALIIVLALVVLVSAIVVAYLGRTTGDRQLARATFSQTSADQLARSALDIIVADFKQEIAAGSNASSNGTTTVYIPSSSGNVVPMRSGNVASIPNLIRRSVRSESSISPGVRSRASAINSTTDPSTNGRSVNAMRWNRHYFIPQSDPSKDSPQPTAAFGAPDWVIVSRSGPAIRSTIGSGDTALSYSTPTNMDYVVGRYAYAVFDEGGLLDANVAGFPSTVDGTNIGRKGSLAFADLTALPTTGSGKVTTAAVDHILGWRNYSTIDPSGVFPSFTPTPGGATRFVTYYLDRTRDFRTAALAPLGSSNSDQAFVTRDELVQLRSSMNVAACATLQHLGTFYRGRNVPTWQDSYIRLAGRFPLERFDVLADPANNAQNLKKHFGLVYVAESQTANAHYQYTGAKVNTMQDAIARLNGNSQDPELSVLLRYAYPFSVSDADILSVIASLIDQRDSDSNTTWIEYGDANNPSKAWGADSNRPSDATAPYPAAAPVMLKRAFRSVGELAYGYHQATTPIDFSTAASVDARLLDLFTYNTAAVRAGQVSLNTQNAFVLAAVLQSALTSQSGAKVSSASATAAANQIVAETATRPALGREDVARLASKVTDASFMSSAEARATVARALAEVGQTRTWGLLIDVIGQSGKYPPNAAALSDFAVEAEKHYWLHVAIDRFTGDVVDQQLEAVYE